jgi:hypothetical protein
MKDVTVTLTLDDIKLYDRAKEIGIPSIVISMYGNKIKMLLAEERETEKEACAKVCEQLEDDGGEWDIQQQCANAIRAKSNT